MMILSRDLKMDKMNIFLLLIQTYVIKYTRINCGESKATFWRPALFL